MNEQENQGTIVQDQIVQPSPKNPILKTVIFVIAILLVILIAGGLYLFSQKKTSSSSIKDSTNPIVFDDSDLKISYAGIPSISENSAPVFRVLGPNSATPADTAILTKYIASSTPTNLPPIAQANKIISAYPALLKVFDENSTKPYQCYLGKGESCPLSIVRSMTYLAGVRALVSFEQNKIADAQKTAMNIASLGKNITANADAEITLLVGWIAQKTGYSILSIINSKNKAQIYSETEKNALITQLRNEQKKVSQYSYTRTAEGIDYINSPEKKPASHTIPAYNESFIDEYRKAISANPKSWNPTETKRYFYDSYKIMIANIDLPCGANLPKSVINIGFDPKDQNTENYIGKTIYSTGYADLNSLSSIRCEVESAIKNL